VGWGWFMKAIEEGEKGGEERRRKKKIRGRG
jgi:hypothetical protein